MNGEMRIPVDSSMPSCFVNNRKMKNEKIIKKYIRQLSDLKEQGYKLSYGGKRGGLRQIASAMAMHESEGIYMPSYDFLPERNERVVDFTLIPDGSERGGLAR
jgi:hypothetical protein